jgi:hypothetical protein
MPAGFNLFIVDKLPGVGSAAHAGGFLAGLRLETAAAENATRSWVEPNGPARWGTVNYFFFEPPCPAAAEQAWMHALRRFPTDLISWGPPRE